MVFMAKNDVKNDGFLYVKLELAIVSVVYEFFTNV
ncbi:hypothetical protein AJ90_22065 [Vibrio parahaemolyticus M0605]|nr:hypothetical protein AJ90_22065 [Vibrio parahaemolyticus M0605]